MNIRMHVCKVGGAGDGFCLHNRELCRNAKNELCRTVGTLGRTVKPESQVPRAASDTLLNTVVTSWAAGHSFQRHLCTKSGCSVTPFEPLAPNFTTTSSPDFDRRYRAGPLPRRRIPQQRAAWLSTLARLPQNMAMAADRSAGPVAPIAS